MLKIMRKTLGCLMGATIVFAGCFVLCATETAGRTSAGKEDNYCAWMGRIKDDALVSEIVVPGAHDAGTQGMIWVAETQSHSIKEQLYCGVRYFDIRVRRDEDGDLIIFHGVVDGAKFPQIITDIKEFLITYPTETLFLDFQHFKGGSQEKVWALIREHLISDNLVVENTTDKSDLEFISALNLDDARGKAIVFWGDRSEDDSYKFLRNNDDCSHEGMSLNSYYNSDFHKDSPEVLIKNGYKLYLEKIKQKIATEGHKGIFVLQGQLTDGLLIFGPKSREESMDPKISEYITGLKNSEDLKYINVIMRDFLTREKALQIIELNAAKGLFKGK